MSKVYETKTFLWQTAIAAIFAFIVVPWLARLQVLKEWSGQCYSCPPDALCAQVVTYCSEMVGSIAIYVLTLLIIVHILFYIRYKIKNRA